MRIIGGKFKKKKLLSVPGDATRPTSDRLRESLFNILSASVQNAVVLDLYAGTGALGLEALSRHADHAVFIDNQKSAVSVITRNINACRCEETTRVIRWDISQNLNCLRNTAVPFTLVFMDPPYNQSLISKTLENLVRTGALSENVTIVLEHAASETPETIPDVFLLRDYRRDGKTGVSFLTVKE